MTAYSHPEFIAEAVESILAQDEVGAELVLVDDGSSCDIPAVIAPYKDRIRYIRQNNTGLGPARDTGVEAARGQYVAFCDSDDVHLPYRLSVHANLLDSYPEAAQVFSDLQTYIDGEVLPTTTLRERSLGVDENDFETSIRAAFGAPTTGRARGLSMPEELADRDIYYGRVPALIAARHLAWGGASMFRRSMLLTLGGHDPLLRHWEDWSLVSRLSKRYPMIFWDAPVLLYRQHPGQNTKLAGSINARSYRDVVFRVWKNDASFAAEHPDLLRRMLKLAALRNASYLLEQREYAQARADILSYVRAAPLDRHGYTAMVRNIMHQVLLDRF